MGDSHWGTYKNKKKKSWRGLTQEDLKKNQEKETLEGDSHWGT